jgi:hypothetical protein
MFESNFGIKPLLEPDACKRKRRGHCFVYLQVVYMVSFIALLSNPEIISLDESAEDVI